LADEGAVRRAAVEEIGGVFGDEAHGVPPRDRGPGSDDVVLRVAAEHEDRGERSERHDDGLAQVGTILSDDEQARSRPGREEARLVSPRVEGHSPELVAVHRVHPGSSPRSRWRSPRRAEGHGLAAMALAAARAELFVRARHDLDLRYVAECLAPRAALTAAPRTRAQPRT